MSQAGQKVPDHLRKKVQKAVTPLCVYWGLKFRSGLFWLYFIDLLNIQTLGNDVIEP